MLLNQHATLPCNRVCHIRSKIKLYIGTFLPTATRLPSLYSLVYPPMFWANHKNAISYSHIVKCISILVWWLSLRGRAWASSTIICHCRICHAQVDIYVSHKPTARTDAVRVATYAWTKFYTKALSCISDVYKCRLRIALTWSNLNDCRDRICTALWATCHRQ